MPKLSDIPDARIDWNNIRYNSKSDYLRPKMGFRYCKKCSRLLAVNQYNFHKNKNNPDGYSYICISCTKK